MFWRFWAQSTADAVPRPGRIRTVPLGGGTRLAAPGVFEIARGDVSPVRGVEHPLRGGRVDGAGPSALGSWSSILGASRIVRSDRIPHG